MAGEFRKPEVISLTPNLSEKVGRWLDENTFG
jgi:hypothetical protein